MAVLRKQTILRHAEGLVQLGHLLDDVGILQRGGQAQSHTAKNVSPSASHPASRADSRPSPNRIAIV